MASEKLQVEVVVQSDKANKNLKTVGKGFTELGKTAKTALAGISFVAINMAAKRVMDTFQNQTSKTIDSFKKQESALIGFEAVAKAKGINVTGDFINGLDLVQKGLLSVGDASSAMKNLIASNFDLEQSVELLSGFGDAAAFNRQGSLAFGQSIVGATEGIKNQNSILVDNAGITKNLSVILREAGFSAQDLGNVSTDSAVRLALFNGILNEAALFAGNADMSLETLAGRTVQADVASEKLSQTIGSALSPLVSKYNEILKPIIDNVKAWVDVHPTLTKNVIVVVGALTGFVLIASQLAVLLAALTIAFGVISAPILITIGVIAALVAGGALLVANWDWVKQKSAEVWTAVKDFVSSAVDSIMASVSKMVNVVISGLNAVVRAMNKIPGISIGEMTTVDFGNAIARAEDAAARIAELGSTDIAGPLQQRANGGFVSAGTPYLVGERGPEIFTPNLSGAIIPNNRVGNSINISFSGVFGKDAAEEIGDMIVGRLNLHGAT